MSRQSAWQPDADIPTFPPLDRDLAVDVAVVGGGITGLTAAYLLHKAGKSVALLERSRFGGGDTGHTTAHLTHVTDERLPDLVKRFGVDHARAAWDAGRASMEQVHALVHAEGIDCDFAWVPGYLHAPPGQPGDDLKEDAERAAELGFEARYLDVVPVAGTPGVRFARQAVFHPLKYLAGLARRLKADGVALHEASEATEVRDDPLSLVANGRTVRCKYLVLATHVPLQGLKGLLTAGLFQSKLAPYTSYAVSAGSTAVPAGLWWDTADPYRYLRADNGRLVLGGGDHKTGQASDPDGRFQALEAALADLAPGAAVEHRWSGQVVETVDGLPYIGETADRQFVATGFGGNGMTFGTLGGMMACDAALGRKNPWVELFRPGRVKLGGVWDYLTENADYPYYLVRDRLLAGEGTSLDVLKPGEGKILRLNGERVACHRDGAGTVTAVSATCTHLGCLVRWNPAETTWDCPCHGSRFRPTGEVLAGPAETPLERVTVEP
jgi:glycine/D-amino acid oxidase-like deaminating enzyme/nitrite reductase/ring-hydroxylating ferredoxin subunit